MKKPNAKNITKVFAKSGKVKIHWNKDLDTFALESTDDARESLISTMQSLSALVRIELMLDENYPLTISGLTVVSTGDCNGVIITAYRKFDDDKVFNINTPIIREDSLTPEELITIKMIREEACLYIAGERTQIIMFEDAER